MSTDALDGARRSNPWVSEARAMLSLAWPIILTNMAQTAMTATDVMFMGRLGSSTVAAGALASNLYYAPLMLGLGLVLATSPMIATELGRRRHSVRDVRRTVRQGLWSAVVVSLPIFFLLWQCEAILLLMGQDAGLAAEAGRYMRTLQWGILPFLGYIVLRSFVSALEQPRWALVIGIVGVIVNAIGNWALIFGELGLPAMGIAGSGLATTIANTTMFAGMAAVAILHPRFRCYRLFGRFWRADWPRFGMLWKLGTPMALMLAFEVTIFNAAAFLMGLIDEPSLAAHAIALQICSVTFMVPLGLGQAVTVRIGRAFGAGDKEGVRRAGWTAYVASGLFMSSMALLMLTIPVQLLGAFIDVANPANAQVVALGVTFLAYAAMFQIFDGAQAVGAGMLRGLHDTAVPMVFAAIGYWGVGLPLGVILAFPLGLKGVGIWIGLSAGLAVVALLLLWRWQGRDARFARLASGRIVPIH